MCINNSFPGKDTQVEKMDWSYDVPGLHLGIKCTDTENPLRMGKVYIELDANKVLRKPAQFNTLEVTVHYKLEFLFLKTFVTRVNYTIGHNDGHGKESGRMRLQYRRWPNACSFIFKSETSSFIGKPIIPPYISNLGKLG